MSALPSDGGTVTGEGSTSVLGAALLLLGTGIGTGVLVLPKAMAGVGYLPMAGLLAAGALLSASTTWVLFVAVGRVRSGKGELVQELLGEPGAGHAGPSYAELLAMVAPPGVGLLLDVILAIYGLGCLTSYALFIAIFLQGLPEWPECLASSSRTICLIAFLVFWPMLFPNVGALERFASAGPVALVATSLAIWFREPAKAAARTSPLQAVNDLECGPAVLCIGIFAYMWHMNCVTVARELRDPTPLRCLAVAVLGTSFLGVLYLFIALGGYLSFGAEARQYASITEPYGADPLFVVVRVALAVVLLVGIPLNSFPVRESMVGLVSRVWPQYKLNRNQRIVWSLGISLTLATVAILFPDVVAVITILGGVFASLLMVVFPAWISKMLLPPGLWRLVMVGAAIAFVTLSVSALGIVGNPV